MPFKEKIAWISVVTTILVWGTYFTVVLIGVAHGQRTRDRREPAMAG